MNIEFPKNKYALNLEYGINFQAIADGREITCVISIEALQDIGLSKSMNAKEMFLNNESRIKEIATKKILNGDLVDNKLFICKNDIY